MYFFNIQAIPNHSSIDQSIGGAFVICWIQDSNIENAERRAKQGIVSNGWKITGNEEDPRKTSRDQWIDDKLEYFDQALIDREVWVFHTYPIEKED